MFISASSYCCSNFKHVSLFNLIHPLCAHKITFGAAICPFWIANLCRTCLQARRQQHHRRQDGGAAGESSNSNIRPTSTTNPNIRRTVATNPNIRPSANPNIRPAPSPSASSPPPSYSTLPSPPTADEEGLYETLPHQGSLANSGGGGGASEGIYDDLPGSGAPGAPTWDEERGWVYDGTGGAGAGAGGGVTAGVPPAILPGGLPSMYDQGANDTGGESLYGVLPARVPAPAAPAAAAQTSASPLHLPAGGAAPPSNLRSEYDEEAALAEAMRASMADSSHSPHLPSHSPPAATAAAVGPSLAGREVTEAEALKIAIENSERSALREAAERDGAFPSDFAAASDSAASSGRAASTDQDENAQLQEAIRRSMEAARAHGMAIEIQEQEELLRAVALSNIAMPDFQFETTKRDEWRKKFGLVSGSGGSGSSSNSPRFVRKKDAELQARIKSEAAAAAAAEAEEAAAAATGTAAESPAWEKAAAPTFRGDAVGRVGTELKLLKDDAHAQIATSKVAVVPRTSGGSTTLVGQHALDRGSGSASSSSSSSNAASANAPLNFGGADLDGSGSTEPNCDGDSKAASIDEGRIAFDAPGSHPAAASPDFPLAPAMPDASSFSAGASSSTTATISAAAAAATTAEGSAAPVPDGDGAHAAGSPLEVQGSTPKDNRIGGQVNYVSVDADDRSTHRKTIVASANAGSSGGTSVYVHNIGSAETVKGRSSVKKVRAGYRTSLSPEPPSSSATASSSPPPPAAVAAVAATASADVDILERVATPPQNGRRSLLPKPPPKNSLAPLVQNQFDARRLRGGSPDATNSRRSIEGSGGGGGHFGAGSAESDEGHAAVYTGTWDAHQQSIRGGNGRKDYLISTNSTAVNAVSEAPPKATMLTDVYMQSGRRAGSPASSEPRRRAAAGIRSGLAATSAPATAHELGLVDDGDAGSSASAESLQPADTGDASRRVSSQDVLHSISTAYRSRKPADAGAGVVAGEGAGVGAGLPDDRVDDVEEATTDSPRSRRRLGQNSLKARAGGGKMGGIMREADHADHFLKGKKGSTMAPYTPYKK